MHRQAAPVTNAAIAAQVHQSFDIHRRLASQITFDDKIGYSSTQIRHFRLRQILDLGLGSNFRRIANLLGARIADPVNRSQGNHDVFAYRYVYA